MKTMTASRVVSVLALVVALPAAAPAQERIGVATTVVGPVSITRVAASPTRLKFKDELRLNDRIATGDKALARMLLGASAIVTIREHSVVTITETPAMSIIDVARGRVSVAVDKTQLRPDHVIEITTPHAVAATRGTILVAEVANGTSLFTVLRGIADVYQRDSQTRDTTGAATPVDVHETLRIEPGVGPARPQPISAERARKLADDFTAPVRALPPVDAMVADEVTRATDVANRMARSSRGTSSTLSPTTLPMLSPTLLDNVAVPVTTAVPPNTTAK